MIVKEFIMIKKSIGQLISEKLDIPLEGIASVPTVQIIGNTIMSIDGCVGIKKYETDEIILRTSTFMLKIVGSELSMLTFSQGRVSIRGEIYQYQIESVE